MESILTVLARGPQLLTDMATVRDELNIKTGRTLTLEREIKGSSFTIASACNRRLMTETVQERIRDFDNECGNSWRGHRAGAVGLRGSGDALVLNRYPVSRILSIVEDGDFSAGATLVEGEDFDVDYEEGFVHRRRSGLHSSWDFGGVLIQYIGGYTLPTTSGGDILTTLPADLQKAVLLTISLNILALGRDPALRQYSVPGVLEESFWVGAPVGPNGLPPQIEALIDNYREVVV